MSWDTNTPASEPDSTSLAPGHSHPQHHQPCVRRAQTRVTSSKVHGQDDKALRGPWTAAAPPEQAPAPKEPLASWPAPSGAKGARSVGNAALLARWQTGMICQPRRMGKTVERGPGQSVRPVGEAGPTIERRHCLRGLAVDVEKFACVVHGHWRIENSLLRVAGHTMRRRPRPKRAPANLAINLLNRNGYSGTVLKANNATPPDLLMR